MKDDRDLVEVLKAELEFIKKRGYGRSVRPRGCRRRSFRNLRRASTLVILIVTVLAVNAS